MKIVKSFFFLICITSFLPSSAMEESSSGEIKKNLRKSLAALSLEIPKYPINDARQNFDNLINTFCLTKGDRGYNFLEKLQQEQVNLAKEKYSLELRNFEYIAKSNVLRQEQESLKQQNDNINLVIEQAKEELRKLEVLKQATNIEALKIDYQNKLNALQKKFESDQVSREEQYKKDCLEFQKKVIADNQKSLTSIINKQKAEFAVEFENFKTQSEANHQNEKKVLEIEHENTLEKKITSLKEEYEIKLAKHITKTREDLARDRENTEKQFRQSYTRFFLSFALGSFVTGFGIRYLDIIPIVAKLFNKTH